MEKSVGIVKRFGWNFTQIKERFGTPPNRSFKDDPKHPKKFTLARDYPSYLCTKMKWCDKGLENVCVYRFQSTVQKGGRLSTADWPFFNQYILHFDLRIFVVLKFGIFGDLKSPKWDYWPTISFQKKQKFCFAFSKYIDKRISRVGMFLIKLRSYGVLLCYGAIQKIRWQVRCHTPTT